VDLIGEGYDIAFRPGHLPDSGLIAKKVGRASRILVAAPGYLKVRSVLKHPRDLQDHDCLTLISSIEEKIWTLRSKDGRSAQVVVTARLSSNSLSALKELVLTGEGIALLPNSTCKVELAQGAFIRVLPDWGTEASPVHLVYPPGLSSSAKVREMLPLLEQSVRELYL
jgi:DNA-binding transcriptional LysR family regulator